MIFSSISPPRHYVIILAFARSLLESLMYLEVNMGVGQSAERKYI